MSYPVTYEADYAEKRSRLTTFFRGLMAIPILLVSVVYGVVAGFAIIVAWFAIVLTGRYPQGLYDFIAGAVRLGTRANAYFSLVTDVYPPFNGADDKAYPVRVEIGPPAESYSRLKTFFRIILLIPPYIISYVLQIVGFVVTVAAWFAIIILGKQPAGLQSALNMYYGYATRFFAYAALLTETWPPLGDVAAELAPGGTTIPALNS